MAGTAILPIFSGEIFCSDPGETVINGMAFSSRTVNCGKKGRGFGKDVRFDSGNITGCPVCRFFYSIDFMSVI